MNKLYNDTAVQAIANAIRAKNGSSDTYTIAEMSTALNDISYYAKSTISNVAFATFEADGLPFNSLKVGINAVQSGSGDPSPTNIRPISGWDAANVSDVDDVDNPTVTQTTTISLPQTVYGGELDVVNGVLKLTHKIKVFDGVTNPFIITNDGVLFVDDAMSDGKADELISNQREYGTIITGAKSAINYPNKLCVQALNGIRLALYDANYTTAEDFNTFLASNPMQVCYELANPISTNLTPTLIKSLNGTNNLSVDCGEIIELEYFKEV